MMKFDVREAFANHKKETFVLLIISVTVIAFFCLIKESNVDLSVGLVVETWSQDITSPDEDLIAKNNTIYEDSNNRTTSTPTTSSYPASSSSTISYSTTSSSSSTTSPSTSSYSTGSPPSDDSLNLEPPSQEWAHAQFSKSMALLNVRYDPPNHWELCSIRTYFFPKINTIFTGTPKTGCSNWIISLLEAEGELMDREIDPSRVAFVHGRMSKNRRIKQMLDDNRVTKTELENAFSFVVVRNPWTRMVSGFRDKLSNEITQGGSFRGIGMHIIREMRGITDPVLVEKLYPTFAEFAQYLIKKEGYRCDAHFARQTVTLCTPHVMYDLIVPLEHSTRLSQEVWSRINATDTPLLGSYDKSSDPRFQKSTLFAKQWLKDLGSEVTDKLYHIYKADFALLNYSNFTHPDFPLPLHS
ncbi:carbohydrate sulfotransferase 11-like [Bolinopsis microptera]|uniref:carbohydrate sulfotransferase 11-like n=1 Tax=Bolinopsis microptera TaxID=2820187 RepID=UPI003079B62D